MTHEMKLNRQPFHNIKTGKKTIELRLYDEKRKRIKAGDCICFTQVDGGESLTVKVLKLYVFPSFEALYKALPLDKCGYDDPSVANARDMEAYYSKEEQEKFGVVGIEVQVCKI